MNKNMKIGASLLLTTSVIALPVITVISCGKDQGANDTSTQENKSLNTKIENLTKKISSLETEKLNYIKTLQQNREYNNNLEEKLTKLSKSKTDLETQLQSKIDEIAKLTKVKTDLDSKINEIANLNEVKTDLETQLQTKIDEITKLKSDSATLIVDKKDLVANLKSNLDEISKLKAKVIDLQSKLNTVQPNTKVVKWIDDPANKKWLEYYTIDNHPEHGNDFAQLLYWTAYRFTLSDNVLRGHKIDNSDVKKYINTLNPILARMSKHFGIPLSNHGWDSIVGEIIKEINTKFAGYEFAGKPLDGSPDDPRGQFIFGEDVVIGYNIVEAIYHMIQVTAHGAVKIIPTPTTPTTSIY